MTVIASPNVVTSGLVLSLDAANIKSYPGSGTAWSDLSGLGNNITLTGGVTYNTLNNGYLTFNGSTGYANFYAPNLTTTATVEIFAKASLFNETMFFGWNQYTLYCKSGAIGFNTFNGDIYGLSSAEVSNLALLNNWIHYVFEMRSDVSYTNNKIYINSTSQTLSQQSGTQNSSNRTFNSGNGRIAGAINDGGIYRMPMDLPVFRVYNRSLTQTEVSQNYNALRSRYAI
jgi:hypothetical protein